MSGPLFASLYEVEKIKLPTFVNNDVVAAISPIFCVWWICFSTDSPMGTNCTLFADLFLYSYAANLIDGVMISMHTSSDNLLLTYFFMLHML